MMMGCGIKTGMTGWLALERLWSFFASAAAVE